MRGADAPTRFWSKVEESEQGCWVWQGSNGKGYGRFWETNDYPVSAHRWAYEQMVGPVPDGLQLDHLCRNRSCVNPYHLEPVTASVNCKRRPDQGLVLGERNGQAKVTADDVREIRRLAAEGVVQRRIAEQFNLQYMQVSRIVRRQRWAHVA